MSFHKNVLKLDFKLIRGTEWDEVFLPELCTDITILEGNTADDCKFNM